MFASIKSCEKSALFEGMSFQSKLRLGAQSSYVVKYFEGSNAVKTTSMRNETRSRYPFHSWLGALINCSKEDNNGQPKKKVLSSCWRCLNCVGSLKVFNKVKFWAPNLSFWPKNDGSCDHFFFLFCLWGPLKLLRPLKKVQILDSWH